jgi:thiol-disulfide isomerase/thioredoxin
MIKKNYLIYTVIAIACAGAGAWVGLARKPAAPQAGPAATAPASAAPVAALFQQQLNDDQGVQRALAQWKGKNLVVNFWAPWCAPCVQEMPELSALQADLNGKNTQIIGIGIDSPTNIAEFTGKHKIAYPVYVGGMAGTDLARQLGNAQGGLPFTVLIGADGQVKKTYLGRLRFEELRADLAIL